MKARLIAASNFTSVATAVGTADATTTTKKLPSAGNPHLSKIPSVKPEVGQNKAR